MLAFLIRRLASTVLVMALVGVFIFLLLHLSPGDPAAIIAGDNATDDQIKGIRKQLGLDDPLIVQFAGSTAPLDRAAVEAALATGPGVPAST